MKRLHEKASITVFLSLLLVLFIGFIMMMTEHARIFGLRQRLVCATDSAMDSLFSMYDRELLNEFDLMLLNENELSNNQDIEEVVSKYLTITQIQNKTICFYLGIYIEEQAALQRLKIRFQSLKMKENYLPEAYWNL